MIISILNYNFGYCVLCRMWLGLCKRNLQRILIGGFNHSEILSGELIICRAGEFTLV